MTIETIPLALVLLLGLSCSGPSPEATVREFLAAADAHDVDAAWALLDEAFEFRDPEGTFRVGREGFRPLLEWDAAVDRRGTATITDVRGDTVPVVIEETNDFLAALGIGPVRSEADVVARDGTIRALVLSPNPAFFARVDSALEPVLEWAGRERPDELDRLLVNGSPVYDGERGRRWIELLEEARAAGVIGSPAPR